MGYQVELTEDETEILNGIELDQTALDHEQYKRQAPLILELLRSLTERNAIPEILLYSNPQICPASADVRHESCSAV